MIIFKIIIILFTSLTQIQSVAPLMTDQPRYVQTGYIHFHSNYSLLQTYDISFSRIQNVPNNIYTVVTSITGGEMGISSTFTNNFILITCINLLPTKFTARLTYQQAMYVIQIFGLYLAYNQNIYYQGFVMHYYLASPSPAIDLYSSNYDGNWLYPTTFPYSPSSYIQFIAPNGFDFVAKTGKFQIYWQITPYMNYNSTHFRLVISGKGIFNKMNFYVIFVKDKLSYQSNPSIYDTKIAGISYLCNNVGSTPKSCPWTNLSPYSIQYNYPSSQTNIFVGLTSFGDAIWIQSHIDLVDALAQFQITGFLIYGYFCSVGYYIKSSNSDCTACNSPCQYCTQVKCLRCPNSYYINNAIIGCTACNLNCQICTSTNCITCDSGYYIDTPTTCAACVSPCLTCTSATACSSCVTNYYFDSGTSTCLACVLPCLTCMSATACSSCVTNYFYFDSGTSTCPACVSPCLTCTSTTACSSCVANYYFDSGISTCLACVSPCLTCTSATACSSCITNYYFNSGTSACPACVSPCLTCMSATACSSCVANYYFDSVASACWACVSPCLACTSTTACNSCVTNYYLDSGSSTCFPCNAPCISCDSATACSSCITGYSFNSLSSSCSLCIYPCLDCNDLRCFLCGNNYVLSPDNTTCESPISDCLFIKQVNGIPTCLFCDIAKNMILQSAQIGCVCMSGYQLNILTDSCQDRCGDGIKHGSQCDDNNTLNNDGCDSTCHLQQGFTCNTNVNPTTCNSTQQLTYQIVSIKKKEDQICSAILVLSPLNKDMPFNILSNNFYSNQNNINCLDFKLIEGNSSVQELSNLTYTLQGVENNNIYLLFNYENQMSKLKARITLDYSQTRYNKTVQTIDFEIKGTQGALECSQFTVMFKPMQNSILVTTLISILSLCVGLFVPKFIGLQSILTMQLIYYSQLLIHDYARWPVGFIYLKYLKISTGYNQILQLTQYETLSNINLKYKKLLIQKTIIQNFNISFIILLIGALLFCINSIKRNIIENILQNQLKLNQIKNIDISNNLQLKQSIKKYNLFRKSNQIIYWMISQLSIWSIIPIFSALRAQFLIDNSTISYLQHPFKSILLDARGVQVFLVLLVIFVIGFNHFKNMFLSPKTMQKIKQKPQQLTYKRFLFVYLLIIGYIIFFCHQKNIYSVPMSIMVLAIHFVFTVTIMIIKPYKQSLRIHAVGLYLNLILYLVFLAVICLINMFDNIPDIMIIGLGYLILGSIGFLLILTVIRLYYQIRYGQSLQKRLKIQRQEQEQKQKQNNQKLVIKKAKRLQYQAKQKLDQVQKLRDLNQYLAQTQIKQVKQRDLLNWLQTRNWQQEQKDKYYYKQFHQKPFGYKDIRQNKQQQDMMSPQRLNNDTYVHRQEQRKKMQQKKQVRQLIELRQKMKQRYRKQQYIRMKEQKQERKKLHKSYKMDKLNLYNN